MINIKQKYNEVVKPALIKEFGIKNPFAVPSIKKVVVNVGVGEAQANKKAIPAVQKQIELITGQKTIVTKAKKSVAAFKIRQGYPIGVKVTLRGDRMHYFIDKLFSIVIPRLRDFRGISESSVDMHGNLNLGFTEQTIFPEIEYDTIDKIRGLEVTIVTTSKKHEVGKRLFELIGVPFVKSNI